MADPDFPNPPQPYTLKQIVKKITSEHGYAEFIHKKVRKARQGDAAAIAVVKAHFEPETKELTDFALTDEQATELKRCTDPRTHLLAFAYYVAYPPS